MGVASVIESLTHILVIRQRQLDRNITLHSKNAISDDELDRSHLALLEAQLEIAKCSPLNRDK